MTDIELEHLRKVVVAYGFAESVCDPIEFARRQQILLYSIGSYLEHIYKEELFRRQSVEADEVS